MYRLLGLLMSLVLVTSVGAADIPIFGKQLLLKDPASGPEKRTVRFRDTKDPAIDPANAADPRINGATLEIVGRGAADGTSGVITLPGGQWTGLGHPAGSKGYKFAGPVNGVKKITLKSGKTGGSLVITGGRVTGPSRSRSPRTVRSTCAWRSAATCIARASRPSTRTSPER